MTTGTFTAFPISWNDSAAAFGLLTALNPSFTGTLTGGTGAWTIGTTQLIKDTSGNVGIGVSPVQALHVKRTGTCAGFFETTAANDALTRFKTSAGEFGSGVGIGTATNCWNVYDFTAGAERMRVESTGSVVEYQPHRFGQFTLSTLPSAATYSGYFIMVTNATGGAKLCFSNGTNWIMVYNNATVS